MLDTRLNEKNEIIKELIRVGINELVANNLATKYYNNEVTKKDLEIIKLEFKNDFDKLNAKIDNKAELLEYKIDTNTKALNEKIDNNTKALNEKIDNNTKALKETKEELVKLIGNTKEDLVKLINEKMGFKHQFFTVLVAVSSITILYIIKSYFNINI